LRLSPEEVERLDQLAAKTNTTRSTVLRGLLMGTPASRQTPRENATVDETCRHFRRWPQEHTRCKDCGATIPVK
jgi:hypothetical protein